MQWAETRDRKQESGDTRVSTHGRIIKGLDPDHEIRMGKQTYWYAYGNGRGGEIRTVVLQMDGKIRDDSKTSSAWMMGGCKENGAGKKGKGVHRVLHQGCPEAKGRAGLPRERSCGKVVMAFLTSFTPSGFSSFVSDDSLQLYDLPSIC